MQFLTDLWMPIVASGLFAFIASFIVHMALPVHKGEWKALPDEGKVAGALEGVGSGQYMFPWGSMADMKNPEFQERLKKGPNGTLTVWSGPVQMGKNIGFMLVFFMVVSVFVAYVAAHCNMPKTTPYLEVFRLCGTTAFMAYGLGWIPQMIWYGQSNKAFWTYLFDGIVYALLTAGTFGWLWSR